MRKITNALACLSFMMMTTASAQTTSDVVYHASRETFQTAKDASVKFLNSLYPMLKISELEPLIDASEDGDGSTATKFSYLFCSDVARSMSRMGHDVKVLTNVEGMHVMLINYLDEEGQISTSDITFDLLERTRKYATELQNWYAKVESSAKIKAPDGSLLLAGLLKDAHREDLRKEYLANLSTFCTVIAKSDGKMSAQEKEWIAELASMTKEQSLDRPTAKLSDENASDDDPFKKLDELIGLGSVKEQVRTLANTVKIQRMKEERGMKVQPMSYHCVFLGNPGTGKTTVARIVADIYRQLGIIKKGHLIETDRSGLVAEYVGQTAPKVNKLVDSALDGILFIDEAYALTQGGGNDYGKEAIATLLKRMEDDRARLVVILAGYSKEMGEFLETNSGLKSRFNNYIDFPDYSADELCEIFEFNMKKNDCNYTKEAAKVVRNYIVDAVKHKDGYFGNARFVRNLLEKVLEEQANRLSHVSGQITNQMLQTLEKSDVDNAIQKMNQQ